MSQFSKEQWDGFYSAIGKIICEWSWLEADIQELVSALTRAVAPSVDTDMRGFQALEILVLNMDLRALTSAAKALVFMLEYDHDFDFAIIPCLNKIENELRNERNRFVHDSSTPYIDGRVGLRKRGTRIERQPGSGSELLHLGYDRIFADLDAVLSLAQQIRDARNGVAQFITEVTELPPKVPRTR